MRTLLLLILACASPDDVFNPRPAEDADGDGWFDFEDCDDADASIHPEADETCDQVDQDCDDVIDEDPTDGSTYWIDEDDDGYGDDDFPSVSCGLEQGYTDESGDCDDEDERVYPGAPDDCDGVDSDCDGLVDEDEADTYYADDDGDGWGGEEVLGCELPEGAVDNDGDCDDADPDVSPDADDDCDNGTDDDCDGRIDEGETRYEDGDGDGFGNAGSTAGSCTVDEGWVEDSTDCDDTDESVYPGAPEFCDDVDQNCDGLAGTLVFVASDTLETDLTEEAGVATETSPYAFTLSEDGELQVCGGPWYLQTTVDTPALSVVGQTDRASDVLVASGVPLLAGGSDAQDLAMQSVTVELSGGTLVEQVPEVYLTDVLLTGTPRASPIVQSDIAVLTNVSFDTLDVTTPELSGQLVSTTSLEMDTVTVDEVVLAIEPAAKGDRVVGGLFFAGTIDATDTVITDLSMDFTGRGGLATSVFGGLVYGDTVSWTDGEVADLTVSYDDSACASSCNLYAYGLGFAAVDLTLTGGDYELDIRITHSTSQSDLYGGLTTGITSVVLEDVWASANLQGTEARGGVVYGFDSVDVDSSTLETCGATSAGGAVYADNTVTLTDATLSGGSSAYGANVYAASGLTCVRSDLVSGTASLGGGGAYVAGGTVRSEDCDWGEGAEDNTPDDLNGDWELLRAPDDFSCDAEGCDTGL